MEKSLTHHQQMVTIFTKLDMYSHSISKDPYNLAVDSEVERTVLAVLESLQAEKFNLPQKLSSGVCNILNKISQRKDLVQKAKGLETKIQKLKI